jgi:hypothetical protein
LAGEHFHRKNVWPRQNAKNRLNAFHRRTKIAHISVLSCTGNPRIRFGAGHRDGRTDGRTSGRTTTDRGHVTPGLGGPSVLCPWSSPHSAVTLCSWSSCHLLLTGACAVVWDLPTCHDDGGEPSKLGMQPPSRPLLSAAIVGRAAARRGLRRQNATDTH